MGAADCGREACSSPWSVAAGIEPPLSARLFLLTHAPIGGHRHRASGRPPRLPLQARARGDGNAAICFPPPVQPMVALLYRSWQDVAVTAITEASGPSTREGARLVS